ncbi:MAG: hypothetical protein GF417_02190 [Candidatus Latescibacteria bacterium]|nr:hypothetical protein [bacterium]MBD3423239.1 hypothetical protein [Candidatus Latescibacterota bacterium]
MSMDDNRTVTEDGRTDRKVNAVSGGLLLIWIGIAMLFDAGWGFGLLVVGIILLGEQAARWIFQVKFDKFWVVAGTASLVAGVLILSGVEVSLVPILLIAAGIALLLSIRGKENKGK